MTNMFSSYNQGYVINNNKINSTMNYEKLTAVYSFNEDFSPVCNLSNTISIEINTNKKNITNSPLISYSLKVMSLALSRALDFEIIIYDTRVEHDEYELFLCICLSINELLAHPFNKANLINEISQISALDSEVLKKASKFNLVTIDKVLLNEDKINISTNSVLNRLINQKNINEVILKSSLPSKVKDKDQLSSVYKYYFSAEKE